MNRPKTICPQPLDLGQIKLLNISVIMPLSAQLRNDYQFSVVCLAECC